MKKLFTYLPVIMLLGSSTVMVSCKKDDVEQVVLKQTGNFKTTFLNGDQPVKDAKVHLYSLDHSKLIDILTTNEAGVVNLQNYLEGNYAYSMELNNPDYVEVYQEFQVISGNSKELSLQVKDHIGKLTVFLTDNNSTIIKEDLQVGVAIVPNSEAFKKAITHKEILALAKDKKYFGTSGKIDFANIPTGIYHLYKINASADTILSTWSSFYNILNHDQKVDFYKVDIVNEMISAKSNFSVTSMNAINSDRESLTTSPFTGVRYFREEGQLKIEFKMENGVAFTGDLSISSNGSYSISWISSSNGDFQLIYQTVASSKITYANGKIIIKADRISTYDYSGESTDTKHYYDVTFITEASPETAI